MLKAAIEKTPDATLEELAEVFGCCFQSIHKRCKKLGITRKKTTLLPTRKKQVKSDIQGKKYERTSVIAACLSEEKEIIAPYVFDGYTDATRFNGWGKECLLPCLKKGQIVVMDNASFHKKKLTKMLI